MAQGAKPGEGGQLPGHQGLSVDRQDPAHHRGRRPHLAAAAPRHLLDRGPRGADPRPEEREPRGAHQRQARGGSRRRHDRGRRGEGARRRRADQRPRRRHRRLAADLDQARGAAVGARPRRDAPDAGAQQPAQPHRGRDRRPAQDRPRRRDRGAARRRGVRLRDRAAGRDRLHHDARLPPEHLPGRRRHAGSAAAREVHGPAGARGQLHALHRAGGARAHGAARLPHRRGDGRPRRPARSRARRSITGRRAASTSPTCSTSPRSTRTGVATARIAQDHGLERSLDVTQAARALRARDRARRGGRGGTADPQRQPRGRHDRRQRDHAAVTARRVCPRTRSGCTSTARRARASARSSRPA